MLATKPVGQGAASKKYDVLTALGAYACAGDKHRQRRVLRFVTLVTARYNWQRGELRVGRVEIARLWGVNERTVKRDVAVLKSDGWLRVKRPAARGRVTVYAIDWDTVLSSTRDAWSRVGPDFEERMTGPSPEEEAPPQSNVVTFPAPEAGASEWDHARAILHRADPAFHANWLANVRRRGCADGILDLEAPTGFHAQYLTTHALPRMLAAVRSVDPSVVKIVIYAQ